MRFIHFIIISAEEKHAVNSVYFTSVLSPLIFVASDDGVFFIARVSTDEVQ